MPTLAAIALISAVLAIPLFAADPPAPYVPQTARERWREYAREALSPGMLAGSAASAGIQMWRGQPEDWRQGGAGYARRVGAIIALQETQMALYHSSAAILGQDTRFELCHCSGTWRRLKFALTQPFVTRDRSGRHVGRFTYIGGHLAGGLISTTWYPDNYRPWGLALAFGASQIGFDAGFQVYREFKPEIRRLLRRK